MTSVVSQGVVERLTQMALHNRDTTTHYSHVNGAIPTHPYQAALPPLVLDNEMDATPTTAWNDTPRTAYKMSPGTDAGDWDAAAVAESDDESDNIVVRSTPYSTYELGITRKQQQQQQHQQFMPSPYRRTPPTNTTMLGDLAAVTSTPGTAFHAQSFASKLNEDIRTAALFPPTATSTVTSSLFAPALHCSTPAQAASPPIHASAAADVIVPQPRSPLPRRPSLHLLPPATPIDPYDRSTRQQQQQQQDAQFQQFQQQYRPYPYPAVLATAWKMPSRLYQPMPTVSLKDLVLPDAKFTCGFDPEVMGSVGGFEQEEDEVIVVTMQQQPQEEVVVDVQPPQMQQTGVKRQRAEEEADDEEDDDEDVDAEGSDEDVDDRDYKDYRVRAVSSATVTRRNPAPKRRRRDVTPLSPTIPTAVSSSPIIAEAPAAPAPRRASAATTKGNRARHLHSDIVRTNPCMYGCTELFSTSYESRRHQEDSHGHGEATEIATLAESASSSSSSSSPFVIYPSNYPFLLDIAIKCNSVGTPWDQRDKKAGEDARRNRDEPMSRELAGTFVEFAKFWKARYICEGCRQSFSRLDSKKRHSEKGCSAAAAARASSG